MKKHKVSLMKITRHSAQIIFFIILPGLYISAFSGIRDIYVALINNSFSAAQMLPQLVEAIIIIPMTVLFGRFFCGWMCAFGAFGDFIYSLSRKLFNMKFRMNESADKALKFVKYIVLIFLTIVLWTFNSTKFDSLSPWDVFGMLATVGKSPAFSYVASNMAAGLILFALIAAASFFVERFFCRYLCPLGAVFAITSRLRIAKIQKPSEKCGKCRICTNNCAMGIPLYKTDVVDSGECIHCMQCVTQCPRKNVTLAVSEKDVRPLVASVAVVTAMTGLYYAGNLGANAVASSNTNISVMSVNSQSTSHSLYLDGTYQESGTGFRGATTEVSVTVKNGKITDISTISYGDDAPFYSRAFSSIKQQIIDSQSSDVNAVSGATFSSNGIMSAVKDALSSAKISATVSSTSKTQPSTSTSSSAASTSSAKTVTVSTVSTSSVSTYKDGTYQGTGTGFRGATTKVSVTVKNGEIADITTISYGDDAPFYSRAFTSIKQQIISSQSTGVNAVSGATFSSKGIMSAVEDALSNAH
jgi:uncharacterized protein with FMN-binding domain/NAD-dependent dihydropyrimidine dehydrogenase PreA subunit